MTSRAAVTVGLWTRGGGARAQLDALRGQRLDRPYEVCVIDIESSAESLAELHTASADFPVPVRVSSLYAEEFDRGDVRNWLALRGEGELLVFLAPGFLPSDADWLQTLVEPFERDRVGAAYCASGRAIGGVAPIVTSLEWDGTSFPEVGAAAVRRSLWVRHPFQRSLAGEDEPTARALHAAGVEWVFPEAARVERAPEGGVESATVQAAFPETRLLEAAPLRLLYVVHGFPPDTWAGTEVYTLELAREMQRLGHRVTILARTDGDKPVEAGGRPEFSVREDTFEDLRVLRLTRRLAVDSIRQTFDDPRAIVAFREVLLRERPDLVHFQHLIHSSAALVDVARGFGLPTIVHCHDYWALCPRVQLIRPNGELCEENRGAGCYLCVHEKGMSQIPRLERLGRERPEVVEDLVREERAQRDVFRRSRSRRGERWQGLGELLERRDFVPAAYAAADLCVSPSRFLRQRMIEAGGFDPRTMLFSDNGLRTERVEALEKQPDPSGRLRLGFVGSLVWYKGCEVLVDAVARLTDLPLQLDFHGDFKPDQDPFHARLRERAAGANVTFHGRFDNSRLSEVYAKIDVLVVPSVWFENSPITIHEAFLTRTPVVTSDIGGMAEFVRDGVDGLQFRVGDAEDLARVLRRFVDEPELLAQLSQDWIPIKDIAENARENEFRYRQLAAQVRPRRPLLFHDHTGSQTAAREGEVEEQGPGVLLVRPGGAVEYDVSLAAGGPREVRVELVAFEAEPGLKLAGRLSVAGRRVGRLEAFRAGDGGDGALEPPEPARGRVRSVGVRLDLEPGAERLRLEPMGRGAHLRVRRVSVLEAPPDIPRTSARDRTWARAKRWLRSLR